MGKLYFNQYDDERCSELEDHLQYMAEHDIKEMEITEARRVTGTGYFYCKLFHEVGEVSEGCGRYCEEYRPNNGKNGRCKHYGYCYESTDKIKTINQ